MRAIASYQNELSTHPLTVYMCVTLSESEQNLMCNSTINVCQCFWFFLSTSAFPDERVIRKLLYVINGQGQNFQFKLTNKQTNIMGTKTWEAIECMDCVIRLTIALYNQGSGGKKQPFWICTLQNPICYSTFEVCLYFWLFMWLF